MRTANCHDGDSTRRKAKKSYRDSLKTLPERRSKKSRIATNSLRRGKENPSNPTTQMSNSHEQLDKR
ncbi:hypothetical protein KFK09_020448 [Dendrobium nobile]|uniref:Uncharacterized protein n=1 Tax=Dendrobium nobile TaxID=94219 RepID=A0A8T3AT05_DENNO|nr:hypothetical protein KFK09_020448 [Dendrobium nobile]